MKADPNRPREVRISLAEYVERVKGLRLDGWQIDICQRLQDAFINPGKRVAIHAPPQFGKSVIISQAYPAWVLGNDPVHRFRLATYNILHSSRFSFVLIQLMKSSEHRLLFPDPEGWIPQERPRVTEWSTTARIKVNDGQASFAALGLQSGLVGTGPDSLIIDDPYKSYEEALSQVIRDKTWRFYDVTAAPRLNDRANVFVMFHRYHQDDIAGRALATSDFDLWRYAAVADGDYEDEETGLRWSDPIGRQPGVPLSTRFSMAYYQRQQRNEQNWQSQFQGRPVGESGNYFNVARLQECKRSEVPPLIYTVRAWDNAAKEEGGDFTAGVLMGVDATGDYWVLDVVRKQAGTAERQAMVGSAAAEDGTLVPVHIPIDPGSAGKDVAWFTAQQLQGWQVIPEPVTGSKELRAYPFSQAVNEGRVHVVSAEWLKQFKSELKYFPAGTYDDQVDAAADAYNWLRKMYLKGTVVKQFRPETHLVTWSEVAARFNPGPPPVPRIPAHWEVQAAIRIDPDPSKPSGLAVVARASVDSGMPDVLFVVGAARAYAGNPEWAVGWLRALLNVRCGGGIKQCGRVILHKDSIDQREVLEQKLALAVDPFEGDTTDGIAELNWYMQRTEQPHHLRAGLGASLLYWVVADGQQDVPVDDAGLLSARQEIVSWSYNEKGEPQTYGGITLDCLRMVMCGFPIGATRLSARQELELKLPEHLRGERLKEYLIEGGAPAVAAWQDELARVERQQRERHDSIQTRGGDGISREREYKTIRDRRRGK